MKLQDMFKLNGKVALVTGGRPGYRKIHCRRAVGARLYLRY